MSNLNNAYYFEITRDENSMLRIDNIKEVPLKDGLYPENFKRGMIQCMDYEDIPGKVRFISRFYEQLFYFRTGLVTGLVDLPTKL